MNVCLRQMSVRVCDRVSAVDLVLLFSSAFDLQTNEVHISTPNTHSTGRKMTFWSNFVCNTLIQGHTRDMRIGRNCKIHDVSAV